ncbi:hypothetical protein J6590_098723, partial [Homalodisca vitripennis]
MLQRIILNNEIKSVPTPLQLQKWLVEFSLLKDSGNFLEEENCSPVNRIAPDVYDSTIQPRRLCEHVGKHILTLGRLKL